tara:strand:- start:2 stop:850 length:849 start_codon:yes stop_codon:yes gene_type:complete
MEITIHNKGQSLGLEVQQDTNKAIIVTGISSNALHLYKNLRIGDCISLKKNDDSLSTNLRDLQSCSHQQSCTLLRTVPIGSVIQTHDPLRPQSHWRIGIVSSYNNKGNDNNANYHIVRFPPGGAAKAWHPLASASEFQYVNEAYAACRVCVSHEGRLYECSTLALIALSVSDGVVSSSTSSSSTSSSSSSTGTAATTSHEQILKVKFPNINANTIQSASRTVVYYLPKSNLIVFQSKSGNEIGIIFLSERFARKFISNIASERIVYVTDRREVFYPHHQEKE